VGPVGGLSVTFVHPIEFRCCPRLISKLPWNVGSGRHYEEASARYAAAVLHSFLVADSEFTRATMLGFWYFAQVYLVETYMRI
jgi:hypothetical protein